MKRRGLCILTVIAASLSVLLCLLCGYRFAQRQYLRYRYPVYYREEILENASQNRLNPYLVIAVIRSESSFRADAVSGVGATGLMQIMPSTGAWIAEELGESETYSEGLLYDPATNIRYGCWYLRYLADLFGGDFKKIVCAYNAGQGNVAKWLNNPELSQDGQLVSIPFPATAAYFEHVYAAYMQYSALYPTLFSDGTEELPNT